MKKCLICNGKMEPYFSKNHNLYSLGLVNYIKCEHCGLVVSKNHFEMPDDKWQELNGQYHSNYLGNDGNPDDPRWMKRLENQTAAIIELAFNDIIPCGRPWVDWGCGDGKLSELLLKKGFSLLKYDRYMFNKGFDFLSDIELKAHKYDLVITTSVFEHVRSLETFSEIDSLLSTDGVLATHTMVKEIIPCDPEWYYLLPVHCTFFTNKSMQILFDRYGYKASIYHPMSRLWFFFRDECGLEDKIVRLNEQNMSQTNEKMYYFKKGFMDYWK